MIRWLGRALGLTEKSSPAQDKNKEEVREIVREAKDEIHASREARMNEVIARRNRLKEEERSLIRVRHNR